MRQPIAILALLLSLAALGCGRDEGPPPPGAPEAATAAAPSAITVQLALDASAAERFPQAIKDLSLSATRDGSTWTIGGHQLHVALAGVAELTVELVEAPDAAQAHFRVNWDRPLEPPSAYAEIEDRLVRLVKKVALFQSDTKPRVTCTLVAAGAEVPCRGAGPG